MKDNLRNYVAFGSLLIAFPLNAQLLTPAMTTAVRDQVDSAEKRAKDALQKAEMAARLAADFKVNADSAFNEARSAAEKAKKGSVGYGHIKHALDNGRSWVYWGQVKNGNRHGYGVMTWKNDVEIAGKFGGKENILTEFMKNGDISSYKEDAGKVIGYCFWNFSDGGTYSGDCTEGARINYGIHTFQNGSTISGEFSGVGDSLITGFAVGENKVNASMVYGRYIKGAINGPARVYREGKIVAEGLLIEDPVSRQFSVVDSAQVNK